MLLGRGLRSPSAFLVIFGATLFNKISKSVEDVRKKLRNDPLSLMP